MKGQYNEKVNATPNQKKLKELLESLGHTNVEVWWDELGPASEMCGPQGGFAFCTDQSGPVPIGYSTKEAIETINQFYSNISNPATESTQEHQEASPPAQRLPLEHEILLYIRTLPEPFHLETPKHIYGACTKCGQMITFAAGEFFAKREQADKYATSQCNCDSALRWQAIDRADQKIQEQFGEGCEISGKTPVDDVVLDALHVLAGCVCGEHIDKATIQLRISNGVIKGTISAKSDGSVNIDRTDTQKTTRTI